jgi:predicted unusual protein kinase regulating ubiquinone biosynthesis (AarF/ABC1/UbiB family)
MSAEWLFIVGQFSTKKILTMERLFGVSMLDADAISQITRKDPESIIITALNVWSTCKCHPEDDGFIETPSLHPSS